MLEKLNERERKLRKELAEVASRAHEFEAHVLPADTVCNIPIRENTAEMKKVFDREDEINRELLRIAKARQRLKK